MFGDQPKDPGLAGPNGLLYLSAGAGSGARNLSPHTVSQSEERGSQPWGGGNFPPVPVGQGEGRRKRKVVGVPLGVRRYSSVSPSLRGGRGGGLSNWVVGWRRGDWFCPLF